MRGAMMSEVSERINKTLEREAIPDGYDLRLSEYWAIRQTAPADAINMAYHYGFVRGQRYQKRKQITRRIGK